MFEPVHRFLGGEPESVSYYPGLVLWHVARLTGVLHVLNHLVIVLGPRVRPVYGKLGKERLRGHGETPYHLEGCNSITLETTNDRGEDHDPVLLNDANRFDGFLAEWAPQLTGSLQAFLCERVNADQRASDTHFVVHGRQVFRVLNHLGGHLGECSEVPGNRTVVLIKEPQSLFSNALEFLFLGRVTLAFDSSESCRIEIVIGKDEATKSQPVQLIDFIYYLVGKSLPRLAPLSDPDRTEATVLGATDHCLDRREHIPSGIE